MYIGKDIKKYLRDLGSRKPAPGGGSTAALCAALSAAILKKSCLFTLGNPKYRKSELRFKKIVIQLNRMEKDALCLVDQDIKAYGSRDMDSAIRIPAKICRLCFDLVKIAAEVLRDGNRNLASDTVFASFLAESSFKGAFIYVETNLAHMKSESGKFRALLKHLKTLKRSLIDLR